MNYRNTENYNHYYKELNLNNKTGYIGVNKIDNGSFFVEIVYNYAKVESNVEVSELNKILTNSMIIVDSIDYNEEIIKNIIDDENTIGADKEYKIDKPEDAESKFSEYLSEYVQEEAVPELPEY